MAFPNPISSNSGVGDTSSSTNHTCNLPPGITSGDLLIILVGSADAPGTVAASGFTFFSTDQVVSEDTDLSIGYKTATGSEGSTITVTTANSTKCACNSWRIQTGTWSGTPEKSTAATGISQTPDPSNATPSWGSADTLWIAATAYNKNRTISSAPAGYTGLLSSLTTGGSGSANVGVGSATRQLNASSEDPGSFVLSNGSDWIGVVIMVQSQVGTQSLTASLYTDADTFFTPTVSRGTMQLTPSLFADGDSFFAPTVTGGVVTLAPSLFVDGDTFFTPTVTGGVATLVPSLYEDADTFHSPTALSTSPSQSLTAGLTENTNFFFSPVVSHTFFDEDQGRPFRRERRQVWRGSAPLMLRYY